MRAIVLAVLVSLFSLLSAEGQLITSRKPDGLAVSTGNVYFTSHDAAGATVWRTSQNSKPGQESVLFWEAGARFGDIVFAHIGGNFFGFFFARKNNVITIRRVSLTGGNATVIATVTDVDIENSHGNLATDGASLFWQDVRAVRKVSVNGGPITTLDQTRQNTARDSSDHRDRAARGALRRLLGRPRWRRAGKAIGFAGPHAAEHRRRDGHIHGH
jgi:hypothetical protein